VVSGERGLVRLEVMAHCCDIHILEHPKRRPRYIRSPNCIRFRIREVGDHAPRYANGCRTDCVGIHGFGPLPNYDKQTHTVQRYLLSGSVDMLDSHQKYVRFWTNVTPVFADKTQNYPLETKMAC
jgi:hypothetical protein